jgi:hypothetical protein
MGVLILINKLSVKNSFQWAKIVIYSDATIHTPDSFLNERIETYARVLLIMGNFYEGAVSRR